MVDLHRRRFPGRRRALTTIALALVASGAFACSALFDFDTRQCSTDADCMGRGAGLVCAAGSCLSTASLPTDDGGGSEGNSGARCTSNSACSAEKGEPARCDGSTGKCVPLKSAECPYILPYDKTGAGAGDGDKEAQKDGAIILGAFLPLPGGSVAGEDVAAYNLAFKEISAFGGLTFTPRRPLVAVLCDANPENIERGVNHLVDDLRVPGMLALFSQRDATRLFQDKMLPAGVFTLNPNDATKALLDIPSNRLLWHLLGVPSDIAVAFRPLVSRVERYVRATPTFEVGARMLRVALVTSDSTTEREISGVIRRSDVGIAFNGRTADENQLAGTFAEFVVPSLEKGATPASVAQVVGNIANFAPDVVVVSTSDEIAYIIPELDARLRPRTDAGATGEANTFYVLSTRNASLDVVLDYIGKGAAAKRNERFLGIQYAGAPDKDEPSSVYQKFLQRIATDVGIADLSSPALDRYRPVENLYDAVYWMAYGIRAAGPDFTSGVDLARGVRLLTSGPKVVRPGTDVEIGDAFLSIANAPPQGVTFLGAMGPPNFNEATGVQTSVGAVYCYKRPDVAGGKAKLRYDALRYSAQGGGTLLGDEFSSKCWVGTF